MFHEFLLDTFQTLNIPPSLGVSSFILVLAETEWLILFQRFKHHPARVTDMSSELVSLTLKQSNIGQVHLDSIRYTWQGQFPANLNHT